MLMEVGDFCRVALELDRLSALAGLECGWTRVIIVGRPREGEGSEWGDASENGTAAC